MLVATALIAATSVMAKVLGTDGDEPALHPLQISAGRFGFAFLALAPYLVWRPPGIEGLPWRPHLGRVICGWSGGAFLFAASARLPLGDANAISFLSPVVTMVLSGLFLGERVGRSRWGPAGVSLLGALILSAPGTEAFRPAAGLALASALLIGIEVVFIKQLSGFERPGRILAVSNGLGGLISIPIALTVWIDPSPRQWLILAFLGMTMLTAQVFFVWANRRSDASFLAPFFYAIPLFAALYDLILFGEGMTGNGLAGMSLILLGGVVLARRATA